MANPLTFLLPLHYHSVRSVLLVQSGPIALALQVAERVRALFPDCEISTVVREADRCAVERAEFAETISARWEDRADIVRLLRRRRYDVVVALASARGSQQLSLLPYLLRARAILVFNDNLDYFPLRLTRLGALACHLSGHRSIAGLVCWAIGRALVLPLAALVLTAAVARIYLRAAWRRTRPVNGPLP